MAFTENNQNVNVIEDDEDEIDVLDLLSEVFKHIRTIITVVIIAALVAYLISAFLIPKTYRTSFTLYVNNRTTEYGANSNLTSSDITAARSLANTYAKIIEGESVLTESANRCGLGSLKYKELQDMVEAETDSDTEIITVYVTGSSPENALYFAQAIAQVSEEKIATVVDGTNMQVIDEPTLPDKKYKPSNIKNGLIAGIAAGVVICGNYVVRYFMDDHVRSETKLEERYGIPVIGSVINVESAKKSHNGYYGYDSGKSGKRKS